MQLCFGEDITFQRHLWLSDIGHATSNLMMTSCIELEKESIITNENASQKQSTPKQPNFKKRCGPCKKKQHEESCERWQPRSGCGGLIMAKFLITTIQANLCRRFTNSSELLLLKILPLSDHHSHFWAATFDFTTFFMLLFFAWAAPFLQFGCFGVDFTSFCNLTNLSFVAGG